MPKLKSTQIERNSTELYIIVTQLITVYLTSTVQISTKYTARFLQYKGFTAVLENFSFQHARTHTAY